MRYINFVTLVLVIIGGLNWALVAGGGYDVDLVAMLFGGVDSILARIVYALVGLAALWQIIPLTQTKWLGERRAQEDRINPSKR
jgi:uncharacterized membrane protein YuzA (DUF378 family)